MSYCRWSSDGWKSDVYTYAHVNGTWTTHVAGNRKVGLETLPPDPFESISEMSNAEFTTKNREYMSALEELESEPIRLPHAGATFEDPTPQACAKTLRMLRDLGYHVPDGVIEELESEVIDEL